MKHSAVHFRAFDNSGDMASVPSAYFDLGVAEFHHVWPVPLEIDPMIPAIIGGGGLFSERSSPGVQMVLERVRSARIGWGLGLNRMGAGRNDALPIWADRFDLIGVRDYGLGLMWVPCASCMHSVFDSQFPIEHDVVVYADYHNQAGLSPGGSPIGYNCVGGDIAQKVRFLASGETVVTSSYHGMYWAVLLGRKVVVVPSGNSSKFYFFRWPVLLAEKETWPMAVRKAMRFPESLEVCRDANRAFYRDAVEVLAETGS